MCAGSPTHVAVLVKDNHASRLALKVAKTFIRNKQKDTLTLVHVVSSELARCAAGSGPRSAVPPLCAMAATSSGSCTSARAICRLQLLC